MYNCTATVWHNNVPTEFHLFPLPNFGDPHFNKTIKSYSAFRKRENTGLYLSQKKAHETKSKWIPPVLRTSLKDKDEWDVDHRLLNDSLAKYNLKRKPEPKWIRHESLWDFYKAVGYDFKKKRYVSPYDCKGVFDAAVTTQMEKAVVAFTQFAEGATLAFQGGPRHPRCHRFTPFRGWRKDRSENAVEVHTVQPA